MVGVPIERFERQQLYRHLLIAARHFFDPVAGQIVEKHVRRRFEETKSVKDIFRLRQVLREGRRNLHKIQAANYGDKKAIEKMLGFGYARQGKHRHEALQKFLPSQTEGRGPHIPGRDRTILPDVGPQFKALIAAHSPERVKEGKPRLPDHIGNNISLARIATLKWKHHKALWARLHAPLEKVEANRLVDIATGKIILKPRKTFRAVPQLPRNANPHHLSERFKRHMYAELLQIIPIMDWSSITQKVYWAPRISELLGEADTKDTEPLKHEEPYPQVEDSTDVEDLEDEAENIEGEDGVQIEEAEEAEELYAEDKRLKG